MEVKLEQVENVYASSLRIGELGPNVTDVKFEQLWKTAVPLTDTKSGIVMEVKPEELNIFVPMVVNWELGPKVTDVKFEQLWNA